MNNHHARKEYLREQIQGAKPEKLILMLYDGALRFMEDAKSHVADPDPYEFTNGLIRAERIIVELMGALKPEIYPEMVGNLMRVYEYAYSRLVEASRKKDVAMIDEVMGLMRGLRETWSEALDKAASEPVRAPDAGGIAKSPAPPERSSRPSFALQA